VGLFGRKKEHDFGKQRGVSAQKPPQQLVYGPPPDNPHQEEEVELCQCDADTCKCPEANCSSETSCCDECTCDECDPECECSECSCKESECDGEKPCCDDCTCDTCGAGPYEDTPSSADDFDLKNITFLYERRDDDADEWQTMECTKCDWSIEYSSAGTSEIEAAVHELQHMIDDKAPPEEMRKKLDIIYGQLETVCEL